MCDYSYQYINNPKIPLPTKPLPHIIKKILRASLRALIITVSGLALAFVLQFLVFFSFKIPTPSMEPAVVAGDYVIAFKQIPGPRYISNYFTMRPGERPNISRWRGIRKIRRGDVAVFNPPYVLRDMDPDLNLFYLKRCVAEAGDTFYIDNGFYRVKSCADTFGNVEAQRRFLQIPDSLVPPAIMHCGPAPLGWTVRRFGPLYLPRAGDTLALDTLNILLYRRPIAYETGRYVRVDSGRIYLGDSLITRYCFRQGYYFMAGDYVSDSQDSRYWGLVPEDHFVGKAAFVWKSKDMHSNKYRWKRFFTKIR